MAWRDFVDIEMISVVSKHATGSLAMIGGIVIVATSAKWVIHDEYIQGVIDYAEKVVATACVLRAVIVMLLELISQTRKTVKKGGGGSASSILVA